MNRAPIENQKHGLRRVVHQSAKELREDCRAYAPLHQHEPQFAANTDRREHVQRSAPDSPGHHRPLVFLASGCARVVVAAHACFVAEQNQRAHLVRNSASDV
jgi:hypothetical protein